MIQRPKQISLLEIQTATNDDRFSHIRMLSPDLRFQYCSRLVDCRFRTCIVAKIKP